MPGVGRIPFNRIRTERGESKREADREKKKDTIRPFLIRSSETTEKKNNKVKVHNLVSQAVCLPSSAIVSIFR